MCTWASEGGPGPSVIPGKDLHAKLKDSQASVQRPSHCTASTPSPGQSEETVRSRDPQARLTTTGPWRPPHLDLGVYRQERAGEQWEPQGAGAADAECPWDRAAGTWDAPHSAGAGPGQWVLLVLTPQGGPALPPTPPTWLGRERCHVLRRLCLLTKLGPATTEVTLISQAASRQERQPQALGASQEGDGGWRPRWPLLRDVSEFYAKGKGRTHLSEDAHTRYGSEKHKERPYVPTAAPAEVGHPLRAWTLSRGGFSETLLAHD